MRTPGHFLLPLVAGLGLMSAAQAGSLEDEEIRAAWKAGRDSAYTGQNLQAEEVAASGQALRNLLSKEHESPYQEIAHELIGFTTAVAWMKQGDFEKAGDAFSAEITAQESALNPFLANTRNPYYFAQDVFVLHSEIAAHTQQEIANTGYLIFPVGGGDHRSFIFVYSTSEPDEKGVAIPGMEGTIQRRMIYVTAPGPQGHYRITDRAQVLADRSFLAALKYDGSQPYLQLDGVKRIVKYSAGELPMVFDSTASKLKLEIDGGKIEQPYAVLSKGGQKPAPYTESFSVLSDSRILATSEGEEVPVISDEQEPQNKEDATPGNSSGAGVSFGEAMKRSNRVRPEHTIGSQESR